MIERKMLSLETTALLDKLYNYRGEDSTILIEMDRAKEKALATKERTASEKKELQDKISNLENDNELLNKQGEQLGILLAGINRDEFSTVLDRLNIDFEPTKIKETLDEKLPKTIDTITSEIKEAKEQLNTVEEEKNLAETTIEEISLHRDAEIINQKRLNEYFEMSLSGNINITRDQIIDLLSQFNLDQEEAREAAKLLMFPEDALFEYDRRYNEDLKSGKSIKEVLHDASDNVLAEETFEEKKEVKAPVIEEEKFEIKPEPIEEPLFVNEEYELNDDPFKIEDLEEQEIKDDELIVLDQNDEISDNDDLVEEITLELEKKELDKAKSKDDLIDFLKDNGIDYLDIDKYELEQLESSFNEDIFKNNIDTLRDLGIDLDILTDNPVLFNDTELKDKINLLISNGKEALDIYFNAKVLIKYNYSELEEAINKIREKGLEPKDVPLMAY